MLNFGCKGTNKRAKHKRKIHFFYLLSSISTYDYRSKVIKKVKSGAFLIKNVYLCGRNLQIQNKIMAQEDVFKKIVSHCKEYGFVFPSSEIYDGLGAVYDYGQNGVELKNNIKQYWWKAMTMLHENIVGIDSAIFMHPTIWKASGHVDAFNDPLIDNRDSKKRYRADVLIEDQIAKYDDKIQKEVEKARKRFGDSFDEAKYLETSERVKETKEKRDKLHARYAAAMQGPDLDELTRSRRAEADHPRRGDCLSHQRNPQLDRRTSVQPDVLYRDGCQRRCFDEDLPASRDSSGHLRELSERSEDRPHEDSFRYRPDRKGFPQ